MSSQQLVDFIQEQLKTVSCYDLFENMVDILLLMIVHVGKAWALTILGE